jgi:tetratricopeptide (TPR) repeat protein
MLKNLIPLLGQMAVATAATYTANSLSSSGVNEHLLESSMWGTFEGIAINIASTSFHYFANKQGKQVYEKYIAGWRGVDGNHRIYQTLRLSQINALRQVVKQYEQQWNIDIQNNVRRVPPPTEVIRTFLNAEFEAAQNMSFLNDNPDSEQNRAILVAALRNLSDTFGSTLATRQAGKISKDDIDHLAGDFKTIAGNAVLEELRLVCFNGEHVSEGLLDSFYGRGSKHDSWHDLFIRDFSAKIRKEQDVANIWQAELLATVKEVQRLHTELLLEIKEDIHIIRNQQQIESATSAEILALVKGLKTAQGVPEDVIIALARPIAPAVTDRDQALNELERAVGIAAKVLKGGANADNLDSLVKDVLDELARLTREEKLDEASKIADDAFARWEQSEAERREASEASGLKLLDAGFNQDLLRRDAKAVAQKLAKRVDITTPDASTRFAALRAVQDEWYERGRDKGLNLDLEVSIELAKITVARASTADERGTALNYLGIALASLGERESDTARLEAAVEAYREALKEWTRERVPLDWARTQNNLGIVLQRLGERESGTARLEAAVAAYHEALKELTHERVPLQWATTQMNVGTALLMLGERERGTARLEAAVEAYHEALKERTRERVPLDWAMTQNNLGVALLSLGERESGTARLKAAVEAYHEALKERTRERVPLQWATTQNNLGIALGVLGGRESGTARLEAAVGADHEALKE